MTRGKRVFMVDKWETFDGLHSVTWAVNGDLNKAAKNYRGNKATKNYGERRFRLQRDAIAQAKKAGIGLGEGAHIGLDLPTGYKEFVVSNGKLVKG
jgi:hypothetical protein